MGWDSIYDWFSNSKNLANLGQFATPVVGGINAYNNYKWAKQANNLARQNYNYNKSLNDRQIAKENLEQDNSQNAFDEIFGTNHKKKKQLADYTQTYQ